MRVIAALLQVLGLSVVAVALWWVAPALGLGFAGASAVVVGVIVERG